jgi:general secretion pathway protein E
MVFRAREGGCSNCLGAGYRGRTAIYELLMIDDTIRTLTNKNADGPTIKKAAMAKGMRTLRDDGAQKVLAGMTSAAEVLMLTAEDTE